MRIKVLGASGSEVPRRNYPAFLVDYPILLDAGTIGVSLNTREESGINRIILTHAKPRYRAEIEKDVQSLADRSIRFLLEGETFSA